MEQYKSIQAIELLAEDTEALHFSLLTAGIETSSLASVNHAAK